MAGCRRVGVVAGLLLAPTWACAGAAPGCDAAVGEWSWFTGGVVSIANDNSLKYNGATLGSWKCSDAGHGVLTLHWNPTGLSDVVSLSTDGNGIAGKNEIGTQVWGKRLGQPAQPVRMAASRVSSSEPRLQPPRVLAPKQFHYDPGIERLFQQGAARCDLDSNAGCAEAFGPLQQAAERGHARAQALLGNMYRGGHGVPKNLQRAAYWYGKAAAQGHRGAAFNLGDMYESGDGLPVDFNKAAANYDVSARQGFPEAQFALGIEYEFGQGVPRSRTMAIFWLGQAASQGDGQAHWIMDFLRSSTTPHFQTPAQLGNWMDQQVAQWMHSNGGQAGPSAGGSAPSSGGGGGCGQYSNPTACNAYKSGATWAADRLQNGESPPSEQSWYTH